MIALFQHGVQGCAKTLRFVPTIPIGAKALSSALITAFIPLWLLFAAPAAYGELVDRIVAIVNDDAITLSDLTEALEPYARQIRDSLYKPEQERKMLFKLREDILAGMIDQKLTDQESRRLGVSVHESEVDQRIEQIKREHFLAEEELKKSLAAEGYSLEEYRKQIKEQMLRIKLINIEVKSKIAVTEKEIRDYYEKNKETYQGKNKYHLRTILIRAPALATADQKADAAKKMEVVVKELEAGASFDEVARRYSEDATAKEGGDLGLLRLEELSPEFKEAVCSMKEGQTSPVVETPHGYQILMVQEIKHLPGKTLKEARIEIQERLYRELVEEKYSAWLKGLRERAYVKIIR
ncbi:MAG: peptidylprolyl isomerase [Desulfobacterales bacterium]|nr:peptidylprolyl isomerase [Desulfobacterales bacterium]